MKPFPRASLLNYLRSNVLLLLRSKNFLSSSPYFANVSNLHCLLQESTRKKSLQVGKICHGLLIESGHQTNILTSNYLINFYSKCGHVGYARYLFDRMLDRTTVSWNSMISGYTHFGDDLEALNLFEQMHREGMALSEVTVSTVLCSCAAQCCLLESKQVHALVIKSGMDFNVYVGTALLDVYSKCGMIEDARLVFEEMPERNPVTWSSMISGYVQSDLYEEGLVLFRRSQRIGLQLTEFTLSAVLSACASIAAAIEGAQLHAVIVRIGFSSNFYIASSLIDMYSKCGRIKEGYCIFTDAEEKSIVLWNAMMAGFSRHACSVEAMVLFEKMQQVGLRPNEFTYVSVLSACSHAGLVDQGRTYFNVMVRDGNVTPNVYHYSCMVDVLGRAGLVTEAWDLIDRMPMKPSVPMWGSLLNSCTIHGDHKLAKIAAAKLCKLEPNNAGNHVLLSNAYAAHRKWEEVATIRKLMKDSGAKKEIGKSWIDVKSSVHVFVAGEWNHPRIGEIYAKLDELANEMKKFAYKCEIQYDLHDVGDEQKEELLKHHSEKLALAYGLISLPAGVPIRINKNIRICGDCHSFMKFASRIMARDIIVRDTNRFHYFRNGFCSCGDFW